MKMTMNQPEKPDTVRDVHIASKEYLEKHTEKMESSSNNEMRFHIQEHRKKVFPEKTAECNRMIEEIKAGYLHNHENKIMDPEPIRQWRAMIKQWEYDNNP